MSSARVAAVMHVLSRFYNVLGIIGTGTYGVVLYGLNLVSQHGEAIKVQFPEAGSKTMPSHALREIQAVALLNHPNIVSAKGFFVLHDGTVCIRMSAYQGTLRQLMVHNPDKRLPLSHVRYVFAQIVRGLAAAFTQYDIIHRDLKPDNILIRHSINVAVTDWGMSRIGFRTTRRHDSSHSPDVVSKWYAPPEALCGSGEYDETLDIWSLGVILAEMWAGECIFKTKDSSTRSRQEFITRSIFPVMGTPTTAEDVAFIESVCRVPLDPLREMPCCLEATIGRSDIPADHIEFLKTLLRYTNRPTIQQVLDSEFVQLAEPPHDNVLSFYADLKLFARKPSSLPSTVSALFTRPDTRILENIPIAPAHGSNLYTCWRTTSFSRDLLTRTWPIFFANTDARPSDAECVYIWLSAMVLSNIVLECFRGVPSDEMYLVSMLTLCSTSSAKSNRFEAPFVRALLPPDIRISDLHAVEAALLRQCHGCIPTPPSWLGELLEDLPAQVRACEFVVFDLIEMGVDVETLVFACKHPEESRFEIHT